MVNCVVWDHVLWVRIPPLRLYNDKLYKGTFGFIIQGWETTQLFFLQVSYKGNYARFPL